MSVRVGIVTVTYRGGNTPLAWAASLQAAVTAAGEAVHVQAVAVDNASGDGTPERLQAAAPWVEVGAHPSNRGFAAGCNAGIARLDRPEVIVLINPDVRVSETFLRTLAALQWPAGLGARGPLVWGADGEVEQSARGFPQASTALFGRTSLLARLMPRSGAATRELRAVPERGTARVDWVSGACLIMTRAALERVGGLDEGYFMYWEDADWCRRAADLGLHVEYEPSLEVRHDQGSSSSSRRVATEIAFHRSALRYWRRHVAQSAASTGLAAVALAARCALKLLAPAAPGARPTAPADRGGCARARRRR